MAYDDLRDWIAALERAGELKKIPTEVDPILEITEITDRVSKRRIQRVAAGVSPARSASANPAAPRSSFKTSRATPARRSSSTSSAPRAA